MYTFFKKNSKVSKEFFELGRQIIKNPIEFSNLFLTEYKPKIVGTDEAFALSAKLLDITDDISYKLDFPTLVHMKPLIQNWPWPAEKWSDHIGIYINKQGKIKIGNYQQTGIVHYVEKDRINQLGGVIEYSDSDDPRISGMSVSRSFGDLDNKYISQNPDIFDYTISDDKFIVLACDGIWDVLSNQDVVNFIIEYFNELKKKGKTINNLKGKSDNNIACKLAEYAINVKKSSDNISIIIIFLKDNL
jgi:hypothetical protein